jgi:hypothetical protein
MLIILKDLIKTILCRRPGFRWKNNIKMDLTERHCKLKLNGSG